MRIATWNVNGIRARAEQFIAWAGADAPDIICLQELKAAPEQIPDPCRLTGYETYWHGQKGYSGVSLHVKEGTGGAAPRFSHPTIDFEKRVVQAEIGDLVVASIYLPNGGKDYEAKIRFLGEMERWVKELHAAGRTVILCGDLNVARAAIDVHPKERKPNVIGQRDDERALFETIIANGLIDTGRHVDPDNENLFTWWAPWRSLRQRNIGWRIDYILASRSLQERIVSCKVRDEIGTSDHAPVVLDLKEGPS
jgi:exodeoxyribonuclease-3